MSQASFALTTKSLKPHVHGEGRLSFVILTEQKQIILTFELPTSQILGFEHKPKTAEEKTKFEESKSFLSDYSKLVLLQADGKTLSDCVLKQFKVGAPQFDSAHSDYDLNYTLHCESLQAIDTLKVLAFRSLKGLSKLKVEGIYNSTPIVASLSPSNDSVHVGLEH